MTHEESIRTRTWVTHDGDFLPFDRIPDDHLRAIRSMLRRQLTPGYNEGTSCEITRYSIVKPVNHSDYAIEMDYNSFRSAWCQVIDAELAQRDALRCA